MFSRSKCLILLNLTKRLQNFSSLSCSWLGRFTSILKLLITIKLSYILLAGWCCEFVEKTLSRKGITKGKYKTKPIQADLGIIFRRNQTYSGVIQAYSGIFRILCNPGIFRTQVNPSIFRTLAYAELVYSESEIYSEPWYIQSPRYTQNLVKHLRCSTLKTPLASKVKYKLKCYGGKKNIYLERSSFSYVG